MRVLMIAVFVGLFLNSLYAMCDGGIEQSKFCAKTLGGIKKVFVKPIVNFKHQDMPGVSNMQVEYGIMLPDYFEKTVVTTDNSRGRYVYEHGGIRVVLFSDVVPAANEDSAIESIAQMKYALSVFTKGLDMDCDLLGQEQVLSLFLWGGVLFQDKAKKIEYIAIDKSNNSFFRKFYDLSTNEYVWEYNFIKNNDVVSVLLHLDSYSVDSEDIAKYIYTINMNKEEQGQGKKQKKTND